MSRAPQQRSGPDTGGTQPGDPLLYSSCWEDPAVLRAALQTEPGSRVLSIASAGDNSLALLLDDPAEVVCLDRNRTQIQVMRLKMGALRHLERAATLELLGAAPSTRRLALLDGLLAALSPETVAFWRQPEPRRWVRAGLLHQGRFDRYLALFRRWVLPLVHDRATVEQLLQLDEPESQRRFYAQRWDTWRWRAVFRLFFSRRVMARRGRDPSFFEHVGQRPVAEAFLARARWALTELPVRDNPYLGLILTGTYRARSWLPPYLSPEGYGVIASRLDRVRVLREDLGAHLAATPADHYDGYNLSDLFEYLDLPGATELQAELARCGRPGARLCYWNLLLHRSRPERLAHRLAPEAERAARLHASDRAFFYRRLVIERVLP